MGSRQFAPGFPTQQRQRLSAFLLGSVGELPGRKILDTGLFASLVYRALAWRAALDVVDVLESVPEQLFLIGAVWAPPRPVHFCALRGHAFRKVVKRADRLAVIDKLINAPRNHDNRENDPNPEPARSFARAGLLLLAFFTEF